MTINLNLLGTLKIFILLIRGKYSFIITEWNQNLFKYSNETFCKTTVATNNRFLFLIQKSLSATNGTFLYLQKWKWPESREVLIWKNIRNLSALDVSWSFIFIMDLLICFSSTNVSTYFAADNQSYFTTTGSLPSTIEAEKEHSYSLAIFFILFIIGIKINCVYILVYRYFVFSSFDPPRSYSACYKISLHSRQPFYDFSWCV